MLTNEEGPYRLAFYQSERGSVPAGKFIEELPERVRLKTGAWLKRLREEGPDLHRPHADMLASPIRELRVTFGRLEVRLLFFIEGRNIIVTHGFLKKTTTIPEREISFAMECHRRWMERRDDR